MQEQSSKHSHNFKLLELKYTKGQDIYLRKKFFFNLQTKEKKKQHTLA